MNLNRMLIVVFLFALITITMVIAKVDAAYHQ